MPIAQGLHADDPIREYSPAKHVVHDDDPMREYVPAGQYAQTEAPERELKPARQIEHVGIIIGLEYPLAQGVHKPPEIDVYPAAQFLHTSSTSLN